VTDEAPPALYLCGQCRKEILAFVGSSWDQFYQPGSRPPFCFGCRVVATEFIEYRRVDPPSGPPVDPKSDPRVWAGRMIEDDDD
jgi:hypothetical protein